MDFETTRKELLKSINVISNNMRDVILHDYYDYLGVDNKYLLSMFCDAYDGFNVFCFALREAAVSQAGLLLRQLLEQTAICYILVSHEELRTKYVEHYKLRIELANLNKAKQIKEISNRYGVPNNPNALSFMDYGWLGFENHNNCNEDGMLEYAGLGDVIPWRKKYLDKLAHTSFLTTSLMGEEGDFPIVNNFIEIAGKLFDYLCVAFHNLTKFNFVFGGVDLFNDLFRMLYQKYKIDIRN